MDGDTNRVLTLTNEALAKGVTPLDFFEDIIGPSLSEIENRFKSSAMILPKMIEGIEPLPPTAEWKRIYDKIYQELKNLVNLNL